ncbi:hypothetical protein [Aphanizomenon flos-aquae]|uniref:hypothetical protein n=1 Tax=Aphanizomenon flos-aquae TaxID=1176 RepID=UPI0004840764|nr:hypothetical protein [Aphanizomenon flos-aquae]
MKIRINNISSLLESNNFLRAFWAELRNRFGKCAWNYQPFKDGTSQTIFLGWADINQKQVIPISLTYSQRAIISGIHFGGQFGEPVVDEESELGQQLKDAVDKAYQCRNNPATIILQVPVFSLYRSLAPYSGQWFEISPDQHPVSLLKIKIRAFDYIDAEAEFLRISSYLLDILSVETNSLFWLSGQKDRQGITSNMKSEETTCPEVNTFVSDQEWMDDIPNSNGYLLISSQAVQFFDRILSKDELSSEEETFIRSCHHFHVAREQDAFINDRLVCTEEQENEDEITFSFQEHPRLKSASMLSRRAEEFATVLYMSAIEVASTIDSNPSERCDTCGQEQYKISARVVDYVKKYLVLEEGHHLIKIFKSHYGKRSKFLHAGVVLRDNSYTGITIPRLDPSSDSGVSQRTSVLIINLREWIGYMLRQQLKSM